MRKANIDDEDVACGDFEECGNLDEGKVKLPNVLGPILMRA